MIHVVTDSRRSYHGMVDRLEQRAGARVIALDPTRERAIVAKRRLVAQLLSPRLLRLRGRWTGEDVVLVIAWYVFPVLALIRLRVLARPRRLVAMATFVQSPAVRRITGALLRALRIPELEFIVFSAAEYARLTGPGGLPAERVHEVTYRSRLEPELAPDHGGAPYVFTGGYTNRDYATFFAAVEGLEHQVVAVASPLNRLGPAPPGVQLLIDLPWAEFERRLADARLVVLPLRAGGEASGQNVLMRAMRYGLPVIATRHPALGEYLGTDYTGWVAAGDVAALRDAIAAAMDDGPFRAQLIQQVTARREALRARGEMADEILAVLQQPPR